MRSDRTICVVWVALCIGLLASPARAEPPKLPVPVVDQSGVAARGYFYVGGHYVGSSEPGKDVMDGQIYVEVLAPKDVRRPFPLVLIHGAGQTATNWMGTPDGRQGGPSSSARLRRLHDQSADARPFGLASGRRCDAHVQRAAGGVQFTASEAVGN